MEEQIDRYFRGELNHNEKIELLRLVDTDEEARIIFRKIRNIYALSSLGDIPSDEKEAEESYGKFIAFRRRKQIFRTLRYISQYAAVAVLFAGLTYWLTSTSKKGQIQDSEQFSFHVPAGQRIQISLQDGTEVWLNAGTTLKCPTRFASHERFVEVDGEAFFEVVEDAERPFIVSSNGLNVKVLGTTFNVNSYSKTGYYCTSLLEGSVKIYPDNNESGGVMLQPNQQLSMENGKYYLTTIKDADYFLWTQGIYSFNNESLANIFNKFELIFDVKIIVTDPSILGWEYTGKFRQSDGIDGILKIINRYHKFKIKKDEETNTITLSDGYNVKPQIPVMPMR